MRTQHSVLVISANHLNETESASVSENDNEGENVEKIK